MIRQPAVAGQFYPGTAVEVVAALDQAIHPVAAPRRVKAVVVPHAGWAYSGATAGIAYSNIVVPERVIMVGPNHMGKGSPYAVYNSGAWRTPIGDVGIAEPLATELLDRCDLLVEDSRAHSLEHSLEVQLPMLLRANPQVKIVPVLIGGNWPGAGGRADLQQIGLALAEVIREFSRPVLLLASTDLNHYENQEISNVKDKLALEAVVKLDEEALLRRVIEEKVSMCGVTATYVVMVAAKNLGATRAELLDYRTSGEVTGDFSSVVGYGAVIIE
jgi:AmmeMemoRadiSam system protein B